MDNLRFVASWKGRIHDAKLQVKVIKHTINITRHNENVMFRQDGLVIGMQLSSLHNKTPLKLHCDLPLPCFPISQTAPCVFRVIWHNLQTVRSCM